MSLHEERLKAHEHLQTVTAAQWRSFFLASDATQGVPAGEMHGGDQVSGASENLHRMPFFVLSREWSRWVKAFYAQNIVTDIAWMKLPEIRVPNWRPSDAAEALVALVLYVRRDRFVEGALGSNIRHGDVQYAIAKLAEEFRPRNND